MPKLHIVIASTRPIRTGAPVGVWAAEQARQHGGFDVEVVDLKDVGLPLLDEPSHPRERRYEHEHTLRWSETVQRADAFVLVLPEYNGGPPASLVNALSYLYHEWLYKPVGFVSYGGVSGGLRSVQTLKQILSSLKMVPMAESVVVPFVATQIEEGAFRPVPELEIAAQTMLGELRRWSDALATLREPREEPAIRNGASARGPMSRPTGQPSTAGPR